MNPLLDRIKFHFSESIQTKINSADTLLPLIMLASEKIVQCLLDGHKVMSCGNGGSACDALHFCSKMLNRFQHERPSLPAIALTGDISTLTAIANEGNYADVFAKQLRALGNPGDVLLAFSASGHSTNVVNAIRAAQDKKIPVIALTGGDGGKIPACLRENDLEIRVPSFETPRIQETHLLIIHCLCDSVDHELFGHGEMVP